MWLRKPFCYGATTVCLSFFLTFPYNVLCFIQIISTFWPMEGTRRIWRGSDDEKRLKRHQMCCLGLRYVFFFFILRDFLLTSVIFRLNLYFWHLKCTRRIGMAGDDENGSKRHQTCHLGPRCVFFFILHVFFNDFYYIHIISTIWPLEGTRRIGMGGDDENGPKRHVWCRLGLRYILLLYSYMPTNKFFYL